MNDNVHILGRDKTPPKEPEIPLFSYLFKLRDGTSIDTYGALIVTPIFVATSLGDGTQIQDFVPIDQISSVQIVKPEQ